MISNIHLTLTPGTDIFPSRKQAADKALADGSVPRLFVIEAEYALALMQAEREWVLALADEIRNGELAWPPA